jgi:uncharacterized membrane protein YcaP (DUF421 family)
MNDQQGIFFDGWQGILEAVICAPILYAVVVLGVRLSGKRTTGQMNNFDWIVTVAIGSITASGIVIERVSILEAATATALLFGLQYLLTSISVRNDRFDRALKAQPRVLLSRGRVLEENCRLERITKEELVSAVRSKGFARLDQVAWVILENDGTFSIIPAEKAASADDEVVPEDLRGPAPDHSVRKSAA